MPPLKRYFILFNCLVLCLVFAKISHAQENIPQEKKSKDLEAAISQQNRTHLELEDKIKQIEEENHSLSHTLEEKSRETDEIKKEMSGLKDKISAKELENEFLESILAAQAKYLNPPQLVKANEKSFDKVIHLNLGFSYGLKGKIEDAVVEYQRALEYDPGDKDIHYNLGYLLAKQNRYKEAIEEYKNALKGLPQDREIYYNLAIIYTTGLKDQKTGAEYYQRFLKLSPTNTGPSLKTEKAPQRY